MCKNWAHKADSIKIAESGNTKYSDIANSGNELYKIFDDKVWFWKTSMLQKTKWIFGFLHGLVGGHCIGVDHTRIFNKKKKYKYDFFQKLTTICIYLYI